MFSVYFIAYSNSTVNPLLYGGLNQTYRKTLLRVLCRKWRSGRPESLASMQGNFRFSWFICPEKFWDWPAFNFRLWVATQRNCHRHALTGRCMFYWAGDGSFIQSRTSREICAMVFTGPKILQYDWIGGRILRVPIGMPSGGWNRQRFVVLTEQRPCISQVCHVNVCPLVATNTSLEETLDV